MASPMGLLIGLILGILGVVFFVGSFLVGFGLSPAPWPIVTLWWLQLPAAVGTVVVAIVVLWLV
jgi:hypothetical protein